MTPATLTEQSEHAFQFPLKLCQREALLARPSTGIGVLLDDKRLLCLKFSNIYSKLNGNISLGLKNKTKNKSLIYIFTEFITKLTC